jgi:biopolymer transport protein ExbD
MEQSLLKRAAGVNTPAGGFRPQLTSLIDVMTILLVFLIKSFSVEGELVTPSRDLTLPVSSARQTPAPAPAVVITQREILVDGAALAPVRSLARSDSMLIEPLFKKLDEMKKAYGASAREVMIQADRDILFAIVKKVMFTCSRAGFDEFTVLVTESAS